MRRGKNRVLWHSGTPYNGKPENKWFDHLKNVQSYNFLWELLLLRILYYFFNSELSVPFIYNNNKKPILFHIFYFAILYNWKTADRMEVGYSLNNRAKQVENAPDSHDAQNYDSFPDIQLQLMSVRPILKKKFLINC